MSNSIKLYPMNPKAMPRTQVVLTSCDHKYPCVCFCVDFNLVWQIISVSSSLFVTTTVALFLTLLLYSNNISSIIAVRVTISAVIVCYQLATHTHTHTHTHIYINRGCHACCKLFTYICMLYKMVVCPSHSALHQVRLCCFLVMHVAGS